MKNLENLTPPNGENKEVDIDTLKSKEDFDKGVEIEKAKFDSNLEEFKAAQEELGGEDGVNEAIDKLGESKLKAIMEKMKDSAAKVANLINKHKDSLIIFGVSGSVLAGVYTGLAASVSMSMVNPNTAVALGVLGGAFSTLVLKQHDNNF